MQVQHVDDFSNADRSENIQFELEPFTDKEAQALFDEIARKFLGLSGDQFRDRWHGGEYDDNPDQFEVMKVAMALPLVERERVK